MVNIINYSKRESVIMSDIEEKQSGKGVLGAITSAFKNSTSVFGAIKNLASAIMKTFGRINQAAIYAEGEADKVPLLQRPRVFLSVFQEQNSERAEREDKHPSPDPSPTTKGPTNKNQEVGGKG